MFKNKRFLIMKISILGLITGLSIFSLTYYPQKAKCSGISGVQNSPVVNIFPLKSPKIEDKNPPIYLTVSSKVPNNSIKKEKIDNTVLVGQFVIGKSTIELPNPKGHNIYKISAQGGKVVLSHRAYNPDGHTWSNPPGNNQLESIKITGETPDKHNILINESHGELDKVYLTNPNLWGSVSVEYSVEKAS